MQAVRASAPGRVHSLPAGGAGAEGFVIDSGMPVLAFLASLRWLDGNPLLVEPYRRAIFARAFSTRPDGTPRFNLVLCGRAKKNWKTADLVLAALYSLVARDSPQGSGGFLLANDQDQAGDDLDLAVKLVRANPELDDALEIRAKELRRKDGRGQLVILPARDVRGAHGKTAAFLGFDEIHEYRDYSLLEALSPDPTRDVLTWVASYDSLWHQPGRPLWDMFVRGRRGDDPRMLFSWYSGTFSTDAAAAQLPPEQRANPSMGSWTNPHYLAEQKLRLPSTKFRRLHLNLGGQPEGAALSGERITDAVVEGRTQLPPVPGRRYVAFCDMSGGSNDDAALAIAHAEGERSVLDLVMDQGQAPPFDPSAAVRRFVATLKWFGVHTVAGDAYAGQTFARMFEEAGITYNATSRSASSFYEQLEPRLNAGLVELLEASKLLEQLAGLVWRGSKITHPGGEHDDLAAAAAGALSLARDTDDGPGTVELVGGGRSYWGKEW